APRMRERRAHGRPAACPGDPEPPRRIGPRFEEVAADRARVVDDVLDAIALRPQPPVERAQVVEAGRAHGDLLDQVGVVRGGAAAHEGDLVIDGLGVGAQEDDARAPVLLGNLHAHDVTVKPHHPLEVADVETDVTEACDSWHGSLLSGCRQGPDHTSTPWAGHAALRFDRTAAVWQDSVEMRRGFSRAPARTWLSRHSTRTKGACKP